MIKLKYRAKPGEFFATYWQPELKTDVVLPPNPAAGLYGYHVLDKNGHAMTILSGDLLAEHEDGSYFIVPAAEVDEKYECVLPGGRIGGATTAYGLLTILIHSMLDALLDEYGEAAVAEGQELFTKFFHVAYHFEPGSPEVKEIGKELVAFMKKTGATEETLRDIIKEFSKEKSTTTPDKHGTGNTEESAGSGTGRATGDTAPVNGDPANQTTSEGGGRPDPKGEGSPEVTGDGLGNHELPAGSDVVGDGAEGAGGKEPVSKQ